MTTKIAVNKLLGKLNTRLKGIRDDLSVRAKQRNTPEDKAIYKQMKERKDLLVSQIAALQSNLTDSQMLTISTQQIDSVEKMLMRGNLTTDELTEIDATLKLFKDYSLNYVPISSMSTTVTGEDGTTIDIDSDLYQRARVLSERVLHLQELFRQKDKANNLITVQEVLDMGATADIYDAVSDVGAWSTKVRQLGTSGIQIGQAIATYIKTLNNKAKTLQKKYEDKFNKSFEDLKTSPLFQQHGYDLMYKKDEYGNTLPFTLTKYTDEFLREQKDMESIWIRENVFKEDWANYYKWKNENFNTISLIDLVSNDDFESLSRLKNNLITKYGEIVGVKFYEESVNKAQAFLADKTIASEQLTVEKFNTWMVENDPSLFIRVLNGEKITDTEGKFIHFTSEQRNNFKKYSHSIINSQNLNKDYVTMQSDAAYFQFYENWLDLVGNYVDKMPLSFTSKHGIKKNIIPYVKKSVTDLLKQGKYSDVLSKVKEDFTGYFSVAGSEETIYHEIDESTGNQSYGVPIHFMQPITKVVDGKIITDYSAMETDLMKVAQTIIPQVSKYQYQLASLGTLEQFSRIISTMKEFTGFDSDGNPINVEEGLKNLKALVDNESRSYLGETSNKAEGVVKGAKIMTAQQKEVVTALEKEKQALINIHKENQELLKDSDTPVSDEMLKKQIEDTTKEFDHKIDQSSRYFSAGQTIRSLLKFYVFKTLGLSPSFIFESFQASVSVAIDAAGNNNYSYTDYLDAVFNIKGHLDNKNKVLKRLFNIHGSSEYGQSASPLEKGAMWLAEKQDMLQKGGILIAMLKRQQIPTVTGENISLYDAFDEEGNWKSELFSEETTKEWNPEQGLSENVERNNFYRFQDKFDAQSKRLFGAYGDDVYLEGKRSTLGKALIMFKTWLGEAIAVRFEEKVERKDLDGFVKGRWRSGMDVYRANKLKDFIPALFTGRTQGLSFPDGDIDAENMKKNMVEMYILLGTIAATFALAKAVGDDDDEEGLLALTIATNLIGRLQQDILYYVSPSEGNKLIKNAIPLIKLYEDFEQVVKVSYKALNGDHYYKSGDFKDWNRLAKESVEFMPVTNGMMKWYKIANIDMTKYK